MRNSIEEYQVLKSELNIRIDKMYTNNYTIITLMFAAWTIITSVYINNETKLLGIIVALLPILLAVLLSQWNENLAGIAALAAYVRIFYEMPSIFSDEDTFCWETCVASTRFLNTKKTASSNKTYVIALIISLLLSTALCLDFSINARDVKSIIIVGSIFAIGIFFSISSIFQNPNRDDKNAVFPPIWIIT